MKIICYDQDNNPIRHLTQWDTNQTIKVTGVTLSAGDDIVVHFTHPCDKVAIAVVATEVTNSSFSVKIPNRLLQSPYNIIAYVYKWRSGEYDIGTQPGRTTYVIDIPVYGRAQPNDYSYSDNVPYFNILPIAEAFRNGFTYGQLHDGFTYDFLNNGLSTS